MKKGMPVFAAAAFCIVCFCCCNSDNTAKNNAISTDSLTIAKGEAAFNQYCSGCHNFKQDGIGPQLGGVVNSASADWIRHFINNPKKTIDAGDQRALLLSKQFKTTMPSFDFFTDDQAQSIIAFLNVHQQPGKKTPKENGREIKNPVPEPIALSGLEVDLQLVTQVPASSDSGKMQLTRITKLDAQPGTGNTFILDLRGKLYQLKGNKTVVYMDMARLKPAFINEPGLATGFGSFAFHPDFMHNGLLYTVHTEPHVSGKQADFAYADSIKTTVEWVLTEWKATNPAAAAFSGTSRELFRVDMVSGIHGVQEITFNPLAKPGSEDYGLLYIGIGDGGSVENGYPFLAHSKQKPWGTVFRINPAGTNSANGHYGIPSGNPFANQGGRALGEIFALGFRNPHRITWSRSGAMLVSNVGQANIESLNLVQAGHDYGWPVREGNFLLDTVIGMENVYPLPANDSSYHFTYPIAEYDHGEGAAISGGYEYWGTAVPELNGKFLFGDIPSGRLFYINMADIRQGKQALIKEWKVKFNGSDKTLKELCGAGRVDLHFGRDARGELYILTKADGKVYKLTGATTK